MIALLILVVILAMFVVILYKQVDSLEERVAKDSRIYFKSKQEILQMISNLDSQVKSLAGKVNEIETNLYLINVATDTADEISKAAKNFLSSLEEAFPESKKALTSQTINEISEEELKDWETEDEDLAEVGVNTTEESGDKQ